MGVGADAPLVPTLAVLLTTRDMIRRLLLLTTSTRVAPRVRAFASATGGAAASAAAVLSSVLKPLGVGYALTCAIAIAAQRKLQYFPSAEHLQHPSLRHPAYAGIEEHEVVAADGTKCMLWHWPAPEQSEDPIEWPYLGRTSSAALTTVMRRLRGKHDFGAFDVIQFHGNAGNREHRLPWMHLLREGLGCSVTVLDYRGYGGSDGSPTERGLIADGRAAHAWLRARQQKGKPRLGGSQRRAVLWGESIGSGVAVALVADGSATADGVQPLLVIEAGFSSCVDVAAAAYPCA